MDVLKQRGEEITQWLRFIERLELRSPEELENKNIKLPQYLYYSIFSEQEGLIDRIISNNESIPFLEETGKRVNSYSFYNHETDTKNDLFYTLRRMPSLSSEEENVYIQVWIDLQSDSLYKMKQSLPKVFFITIIPIIVTCFFITFLISQNTLKPVVKITNTAKEISSTNLDTLLPLNNNGDEIDLLASTFNDLFVRLKKDFDREKQFSSDVSHELKTPVAVILGQTNLLRRWGKEDPEQLDKSLTTILSETKSMQSIIENLLQMSRLEGGRITPSKEYFLVSELTAQISNEVKSISPSATVNFYVNDSITIYSDYELLHQTMMIAITNSIKYCPAPLVLNIKVEQVVPTQFFLKAPVTAKKYPVKTSIKISDNGPGFSESTLDHGFERFFRGDDAHSRKVGGSGLGLSIAKTIILSLGGTIELSNVHDYNDQVCGAQITITL
ncbi:MAG: HAMP domain-containing histidine kinase [Treponema sp.]|nr:HAMP domain-containing histidine kinase [Candidatus Treponema scatequi]